MELRELKYFLTVAEELHFGRAAARLHISQPPLTVHVKRLETELGVLLFERTSRRVSLTPYGEYFRDLIKPILRDLDAAVDDLQEFKAGRRGRVDVGFVSSASYGLVPATVRHMRIRYPHVQLDLQPMTTGEQLQALIDKKLHLGIMRDASAAPGLTFERLMTEELVAVLPEAHPLAQQDEITPDQLVTLPLVLFPQGSMQGYVDNVMRIFHGTKTPPLVVQRAVNQENVMGLVSAAVGASVLPESFSTIHMPGVVTRRISTRPTTNLELVTRNDGTSATAQQFIDVLREVAEEQKQDAAEQPPVPED